MGIRTGPRGTGFWRAGQRDGMGCSPSGDPEGFLGGDREVGLRGRGQSPKLRLGGVLGGTVEESPQGWCSLGQALCLGPCGHSFPLWG